MTHTDSTTELLERKQGKHLGLAERGAIEQLHKMGYSNRKIAERLNCSPSTIGYELKRGTPEYQGRGRKPVYSARRGENSYRENRSRCRRPRKFPRQSDFINWMVDKVRKSKRNCF